MREALNMPDGVCFDRNGQMVLILDAMRGEAAVGLGAFRAVFTFADGYDIDSLPDAEAIRKSISNPQVHVFDRLEQCPLDKGCGIRGAAFSRRAVAVRLTRFLRPGGEGYNALLGLL